MGWFVRKSARLGPVRINFSKRGIGMSAGVKDFRIGTGPRGPYVAGGRGGLYFRQRLGRKPAPRAARQENPAGSTTLVSERSASTPITGGITGRMQQDTSPAQPAFSRRLYSGRVLALLCGAYAAAIVLILSDPATYSSATNTSTTTSSFGVLGSLGVLACIGVVVAICIVDWRGSTTLNGFIKWRAMKGWQQLVVGYFLLSLSPFLVPVYLIQAFNTYRHAKQMEPALRRQRVARLEADLGIMPATEGTCRECGKPLQVGAEFCAYCGASTVAKPLICPVCSATALPDAHFCPKCRTPLHTDA